MEKVVERVEGRGSSVGGCRRERGVAVRRENKPTRAAFWALGSVGSGFWVLGSTS